MIFDKQNNTSVPSKGCYSLRVTTWWLAANMLQSLTEHFPNSREVKYFVSFFYKTADAGFVTAKRKAIGYEEQCNFQDAF